MNDKSYRDQVFQAIVIGLLGGIFLYVLGIVFDIDALRAACGKG